MSAFWSRVNTKRLWITTAAVFAFVFVSDFVIHGWYMGETYKATASLWRSETDMSAFMGWMWMSQFLTSFLLSFIFTKGYEGKGWQEGARYGFLIGLFCVANICMQYAVTPLPSAIFWSWIWTSLVQSTLAGVVASWTYKNN